MQLTRVSHLRRGLETGARPIRISRGLEANRLTVSFHPKLNLEDEILVREGGPVLDLLNGSTTGSPGGRPRHELELQATAFKRGLGAHFRVNWQSGTLRALSAGLADSSGDLIFSPLTYQPAYLDPLGRTLSFNLRKVF